MTAQEVKAGGASLLYEGSDRLSAILKRLTSTERRQVLMESIGAFGVSSTQEHFIDQRAPDGTAWAPSARATATGGKTLRDSNLLFQSLTYKAGHKEVEWGTNRIYAGIHQFGGDIVPKTKKALKFALHNGKVIVTRKVTIPARPFLGVSEEEGRRVEKIAADFTRKETGGAAS